MTDIVVSSGFIDHLFGLTSGDTMWVLASGASSQTTVSDGGRLLIASGGESLGDVVLSGGLEVLSSGATGSDITVSAGGKLSGGGMLSGSTLDYGLVSGVTVSDAGGVASITVENHGVASGVTVGESFANILSGGTARDLLVTEHSLVTVSTSGTTTGTVFASDGGEEDVYGVVHGTVLSNAVDEVIFSGGIAIGTVVWSGGAQEVSSGGVASAAVLRSGGSQYVESGAHAKATVVSLGGIEFDSSGGVAQNSIIASGGQEHVLSGGLASGFTTSSGGGLVVSSGGVAGVAATGGSTNFGFVDVQSGGELDLAGTLYNAGFVTLDNSNIVKVTAAKAVLTGSGLIDMIDADLITGLSSSDVLDNESETIAGTGTIGDESLTVINRGVIDANQLGGLTLNATLVTNTGLIEAEPGDALNVFGSINNSGGVIDAKGGQIVLQASATISGGVLMASGIGQFTVNGDAGLDGSGQVVTNNAKISVADATQLTLDGAIDNLGEISLESVDFVTNLVIDGPTVTLTGSGTVLMGGSGNGIEGDATTFTNVLVNVDNTIVGGGEIGEQRLILVNSGTIDANNPDASIALDATSVTNTGLIESTDEAALIINTTINNSGGRIAANGGDIYLDAGAVILGGTLASTSGLGIYVDNPSPSVATLNGVASPVTNTGDITILDSTQLDIVGAIVNSGVIVLNAGGDNTDLVVNGANATLTGGGTLELTDSADNRIYGASAADTLTNVDNTIEGGGQIGAGQLTLVNKGTIDATGSSEGLTIDATTFNTGLIEDTGPGGLLIDGVIRNAGGVIAANRNSVDLNAGAVVSGGLLTASQQGQFFVVGAAATFSGTTASPLTLSATVSVDDAAQLNLAGAIVNDGVISLEGGADTTTLEISAANATLTGHGVIKLGDGSHNRITGAASADVLDNETNTIQGAGEIGGSRLTLINRGTIDANSADVGMQIDATAVTNTGLIESTNEGGLTISSTINNSGGVIAASDGVVFLAATIEGGVLSSTAAGVFHDAGGASFDGTASLLTNRALFHVDNGLQLSLEGAIANNGTISLDASGEFTSLLVDSAEATLTGTGTIVLADDPNSRIFGDVPADVLDNETNTIEGAGEIGVGQLTLINRGTIDATGATNALFISATAATNTGLMEATTAPGLIIESVIKNSGGVIGAFGGDVLIQSGAAISGGTFSGQGGGDNLIEVMSGGSVIGASVGEGALEILSAGAVQRDVTVLLSGRERVLSGATVTGTVILKGGSEVTSAGAATSGATVSSGGKLLGPGSLFGAVDDHGVISGALLRSGAVLDVLSGGVTEAVRISKGGLEILSGGRATGAVVSSGGVLRVVSGGTATATLLHSGGTETIGVGGKAAGTVLSGGFEYDYGTASATVLRAGGHELVEAHGSASGSLISASGQEVVSSGGVTIAATLFNLGSLIVSSGGTVSGGLTIHAGKITLDGAMSAGQVVDFVGAAGTLKLDNLAAFQAKISGLSTIAEKIDLGGFTFSAGETVTWTQAGTSGTLKVHDGAKTASLTLIGTYVTGDFTLSNDNSGGTFVVDPPVSSLAVAAPAAAQFVQAVAGLDPGRGGPAAIHSGGTASMIAPPLLNATASGAAHG